MKPSGDNCFRNDFVNYSMNRKTLKCAVSKLCMTQNDIRSSRR